MVDLDALLDEADLRRRQERESVTDIESELRAVAALLEDAAASLREGEMYAHHARRPVERALSRLTAALAAKEAR